MKNELIKYKVKNDIIFSYIFSKEDILKEFLQAILKWDIEKVEVQNQFRLDREHFNDKLGVIDIKATINDDTLVNVEMQNRVHKNYEKRVYLYFGNLARKTIKKGMTYDKMKDIVAINILNESMFSDIDKVHSIWQLRENDYLDAEPLKGLEVHFIDLERFRMSNPNLDDKLNQWLAFVDTENEKWVRTVMDKNNKINEALKLKDDFTCDDEALDLIEQRLIWEIDYNTFIKEAKEEGEEKGENNAKLKIAKSMLKKNMDIDTISEITGLAKDEIIKLKS